MTNSIPTNANARGAPHIPASALSGAQPDVKVEVPPKYDQVEYWVIVSTDGQNCRVLKTEPARLGVHEVAVRFVLKVPRREKKLTQTIELTLPDEVTHIAKIDVSVPK